MKIWLLLGVAVVCGLTGCGPSDPARVVADAPQPIVQTNVDPVHPPDDDAPAWASGDVERDGWFWVAGSSEGQDANPEAAVLSARAELGRIRSVRIRSITESVDVELRRGTDGGFASRFGSAAQGHSDQVLSGSEVVQRQAQHLGNGRTRWWAQVRIPAAVLLPERRLADALGVADQTARRAALRSCAETYAGGDTYARQLAVVAARLAVLAGGGVEELLLQAGCLMQDARNDEAAGILDGLVPLLDGQPDSVFRRYDALYIQLMATADSAKALADHLHGMAKTLASTMTSKPVVRRIADGYEAIFDLPDRPMRVIGIWFDHEDIARIALPGSDVPIQGAYTARFVWRGSPTPPRGNVLVLAVPPEHPALATAESLKGLRLDAQNRDADLAAWSSFFRSLGLQAGVRGFTIALAP